MRRAHVELQHSASSSCSLEPPTLSAPPTALLRFGNTLVRRRAYTYADGFTPRRRHAQPSAGYTFSRSGDFSSRKWHEHSSSRTHESDARSSGKYHRQLHQQQQQLEGPQGKHFQGCSVSTQGNEGALPTGRGGGPHGDIRVGEAWSESVVEPEGDPQGHEGGGARGTGQRRPGKEGSGMGTF